jgi:hypothetical protein
MFRVCRRSSSRIAAARFKTRRLEMEEMESRLVPAGTKPMSAAQPAAPSAALATVLPQSAVHVLLSTPPSAAVPAALAQPIASAASTAAFTTNPLSPAKVPGVPEGALPANLVAQLGYAGLLQRDPRAAFDLSLVYSGGDEGEVPMSAQPPRVPVLLPTGILGSAEENERASERDIAAANSDEQSNPAPTTDEILAPQIDASRR